MMMASPIQVAMPPLLGPTFASHTPQSVHSAALDVPKGLKDIQKQATDFGRAVGDGLEGLGKLASAGLRTLSASSSDDDNSYREI